MNYLNRDWCLVLVDNSCSLSFKILPPPPPPLFLSFFSGLQLHRVWGLFLIYHISLKFFPGFFIRISLFLFTNCPAFSLLIMFSAIFNALLFEFLKLDLFFIPEFPLFYRFKFCGESLNFNILSPSCPLFPWT